MTLPSTIAVGLAILLGASNALAAAISGTLFNDLSGDGNGAVDPGLPGWTIQLRDGSSNTLLATTTTAADGTYSFANLPQANYSLLAILMSGWQTTTPAGGSYSFTLDSDRTGLDFGEFQLVSVSGSIYNDLGNNGSRDVGDPGLAGWTAQVLNSLNNVVASATTDALGNYTVQNVGPGSFTLQEVLQPGWAITQPTNPSFYSFTSTSGVNVVGGIFGNFGANVVPEPATLALFGLGLAGLGFARRKSH